VIQQADSTSAGVDSVLPASTPAIEKMPETPNFLNAPVPNAPVSNAPVSNAQAPVPGAPVSNAPVPSAPIPNAPASVPNALVPNARPRPMPRVCNLFTEKVRVTTDILLRSLSLRIPFQGSFALRLGPKPLPPLSQAQDY
jgi:hypothetical protein